MKLYDTDARSRVVPQLAAAMPVVSKDRRSYTIPLRRGVLFNDGTPFDAAAVVTSIERHRSDPESTRASDLEPVEAVAAAGRYTVVLRLEEPFAPLVDVLASAATAILSPTQLAKGADGFAQGPVCVGPFTVDEQIAGDSVTVVKSPYYYDRDRVRLDRIVFKSIRNGPAAAAALRAGDFRRSTRSHRRSSEAFARPRACGSWGARRWAPSISPSTSGTGAAPETCRT